MSNIGIYLIFFIWLSFSACQSATSTAEKNDTDSLVIADSLLAKSDSFHFAPDSATMEELPKPDSTVGTLHPSKDVDTKNVDPDKLVSFAETLIGVPYVYGSTSPKVGFDCSGFITYVFNNFDIKVPRSSIDFTNVGKEIPVKEAKRGDIILFTGTDPLERAVGHMGIIVSNTDTLKFIHSTSGKAMGVTITPFNAGYQKRFVKTIRVFGK
jgi:cell wall-associated NlpC family hydrolase